MRMRLFSLILSPFWLCLFVLQGLSADIHRWSRDDVLVVNGHKAKLYAANFLRDGSRLATSSKDGTVKLWDASSGKELKSIGSGRPVTDFVFNHENTKVAVARFYRAMIYDAATGAKLFDVRHGVDGHLSGGRQGEFIASVAWLGVNHLISGSWDGTARVWEIATEKEVARLVHPARVMSVGVLPDMTIVTGSVDGIVRFWDATTKQLKREVAAHVFSGEKVFGINTFAFSSDHTLMVTSGRDHQAKVWDVASGRLISILKGHKRAVTQAVFSPDDNFVLTASSDGTVRIWKTQTGRQVNELTGQKGRIVGLDIATDGRLITVAAVDDVWIWQPQ